MASEGPHCLRNASDILFAWSDATNLSFPPEILVWDCLNDRTIATRKGSYSNDRDRKAHSIVYT